MREPLDVGGLTLLSVEVVERELIEAAQRLGMSVELLKDGDYGGDGVGEPVFAARYNLGILLHALSFRETIAVSG